MSTSTSTSTSTCPSTSISPPSRNTRSKRKSVNKENQDPNVDATTPITEKKTQSNKKNTKNKKQKTSARASASASASTSASAAPSSSSTVSDDVKAPAEEITPRIRFEKYLNDLGEKYPNHTVMLLENLPTNEEEEEEDEDEEESDKEPNASYEDYDKLARIIIPTSASTAYEEFHQQLLDAIDCSDGFVMTWTKHSDIVMDLLQHRITTFNNLSRQIHRSPTTITPQAFNLLFATTMVMTEFQFWYCDTEEPQACDEMAKNILKGAWNRLLKRSDQELGFVEARTRTDLKRWLYKSYKDIHQTIENISGI